MQVKLPGQLSHWHKLLSLFPDDIAEAFNQLLLKLAPLIGELAHDELDGAIEPDGYSGLTRKANYERLLLSEWALGDYHPDEFLRKAVSGEHQFLALSQKEKRQTKVSVLLLDCGPALLGQPRILQMALIILFARRAHASGAEFFWGIMQDPDAALFSDVNQFRLQHFLDARSIDLADPNNIKTKLTSLGSDIDDLWLVGSQLHPDFPAESHFIGIECPFLTPDTLQLSIVNSAKRPKVVSLQLPDKANQTKVLRNPFINKSQPKALPVDSNAGWFIGCNGRQVAFLNKFGEIQVYSIPLKPQRNLPKVMRTGVMKTGRRLLGFHLSKQSIQLLTCDREHFFFENKTARFSEIVIRRQQMIQTDGNKLQNLIVSDTNQYILICDSNRRMRQIDPGVTSKNVTTRFRNVIAHGLYNSCGICISFDKHSKELTLAWFINQDNGRRWVFHCQTERTPKVFIHGSGVWSLSQIGCFAFEADQDIWEIIVNGEDFRFYVPGDFHIIGVLANCKKLSQCDTKKEPCLVGYHPETETLNAIFDNSSVLLCDLSEGAKNLELNSHHPLVHYNSENGDFVTLDLRNGKELMRVEDAQ